MANDWQISFVRRFGSSLSSIKVRNYLVMANRQHTRWSPTMDKILIELLLDHTVNSTSRMSNNGWECETLSMMARELNQRLNSSVGDGNVRSRMKTLKRDYIAVKELLESTEFGFSYNQQTKCIDADRQAWDAYFRAHPANDT
ncbi:hypothetical protein IFM89_003883 [Coptis chinensis]|uniref:Myb/SANT-like domain-containing protein n=1 Tax=Coptis chinensis TaxID=261450 RepID=A0A835I2N8_9MAGN|nr:hypothetical protein IFM89_003883 [Coptis chinensis]